MSQHVDNDVLADFHEGLLSDHDQALVDRHLAACASCAAAADGLRDLQLFLRQAGSAPEPMPAALVDRFDAVLVAESQSRARSRPTDVVARRRGTRAHRRRASSLPRILLAAASVAVLGAAGVAAVKTFGQEQSPVAARPHATSSASASPSASGPHTYGFKAGGTTPLLTASGFAAEVDKLVEQRQGSASESPNKPFGTEGNSGVAGSSNRCIDTLLQAKSFGKTLATRQAQLDGVPVTLVIAGTPTSDAVRVVAVRGCPGGGARIVTNAPVTIP